MAGLAQTLQHLIIAGKEFFGRDRVEHLPDVVVTRDLLQMEQALGIALTLGLLQGLLMGQEGGTLGEENRKGTQADVLHGILEVAARAPVGKAAQNPAQLQQVLVPGFEGVGTHALNLWRASGQSALR